MAADAWTREDSERMLDGHFTHWVHAAAMPDEDESYEVVLTHRALACCGEPFEGAFTLGTRGAHGSTVA